ncbi:MAG: glycosyltransferase family 2 protein [Ferruginibacter sp.]|nr:glycosyltransferase family 2 protein [Rhodoferax sp.]
MAFQKTSEISIVIPVFNTGDYLLEAVNSVLNQGSTTNCITPSFEILIIDDCSSDFRTIEILEYFSTLDERITVIKNKRKKGVAGARNMGILHSQSSWIGFLDSDDIWIPKALALRWHHILENKDIKWIGAPFLILRPGIRDGNNFIFEKTENLLKNSDLDKNIIEIKCLKRPVAEFSKSCMVGTSTVLIRRDLIMQKGMFNEDLPRTEDYHLWFKCAFDNDLWMLKSETSFYRIHSASLTHGNTPKFLHEDVMVELLLKEPMGVVHADLLLRRLDLVMQDTCYFYRERKLFKAARKTATQWLKKRPLNVKAWKELAASFFQFS